MTLNGASIEDQIIEFLVEQGTVGIQHNQLRQKFRLYMSAADLKIFMHQLWEDRKVDKYVINQGKTAGTWWRATTEILND